CLCRNVCRQKRPGGRSRQPYVSFVTYAPDSRARPPHGQCRSSAAQARASPGEGGGCRYTSPMPTLVCGSLAFDTIMVFPDQFKKHILADQIHILNVSFMVPAM